MTFFNIIPNFSLGSTFRAILNGHSVRENKRGWADYGDTQYTELSPFTLVADTPTLLPNNGLTGFKGQEPENTVLYDTSTGKIPGREGSDLNISVEMTVTPTHPSTTYMNLWIDIGGVIPPLYTRTQTFPKGQNVAHPWHFSITGYTLDTWAANGGLIYVQAPGSAEIHSIRYILSVQNPAR